MLKFALRVLLTAVAFSFIFPKLTPGVAIAGQFWPEGIIAALVFAVTAYIIGVVINLAATAFAIGTLGFGLLLIVPLYLLGFWLIPAIQLQVAASWFSEIFTVSSWWSAIGAGLILMIINAMTASYSRSSSNSSRD